MKRRDFIKKLLATVTAPVVALKANPELKGERGWLQGISIIRTDFDVESTYGTAPEDWMPQGFSYQRLFTKEMLDDTIVDIRNHMARAIATSIDDAMMNGAPGEESNNRNQYISASVSRVSEDTKQKVVTFNGHSMDTTPDIERS